MGNDEILQVRDKRANNRYFIDNVLLRGGWGAKLGPHGIAVYNAIALHADNDTQVAYPSYKKIADLTGMSPRQVPRELEKLARYRIIHIESRAAERKSSLITLLDEGEWIPPKDMTEGHMTGSHMSDSPQTNDSESSEHMTGSHTNNTHENNTQGTKPKGETAPKRTYLGDLFAGNVNLREGEKLIQQADWDIHSPEHRQAMAVFLEASRLPIPPDEGRGDWIKSINIHVQAYGITRLEDLYPRIIAKMSDERLSISRPGSVTNPLAALVGEMNRENGRQSQQTADPGPLPEFVTS